MKKHQASREPAQYRRPPEKVQGRRSGVGMDVVENIFFGVVMVLILVFAIVILRSVGSAWSLIGYSIVFWALMAYLALPRLHRTLTSIYVPSYFIGRTVTPDGLLGDPVNLAVNGSARQIHTAMQKAGWTLADPVTLGSSLGIVKSSLTRKSYPEAPVSPLLLFGRIQDFAYQQEVDGNAAQRHHIRFWRCPQDWPLPGGGHRVQWLAAGTYDRAVGLSLFTLQVTHKIDADIDVERDYVVDSVLHAVPEAEVAVIEDFSTGYHSRNGGGDAVRTDGDLPVLQLEHVPATETAGSTSLAGRATDSASSPEDVIQDVARRPFSIVAAWALTLVSLLTFAADTVLNPGDLFSDVDTTGDSQLENTIAVGVVLAVFALLMGFILFLGWRTFQGSQRARLTMIVLVTISQTGQMIAFFQGGRPSTGALLSASIDLLTVYALTSLSARAWTRGGAERARAEAAA
ncbi:LssY C-terminal domain-containing protein [Kocuria sp.]|uniref:LssY C-terminal domain-containing protein n=1 Tax=Kocuria sp. TaxID=1871328 RepID=UPI0026DAD4C0|nr:LssY C-terminal domain-containing protein [Kocuria sp.]MDO4919829.1 LssY C-terminal domain-containing protein [Kocuria sp.]